MKERLKEILQLGNVVALYELHCRETDEPTDNKKRAVKTTVHFLLLGQKMPLHRTAEDFGSYILEEPNSSNDLAPDDPGKGT